MTPSKSPKKQASFKARLDPASKSALKVLLMGNELMEVDRAEGLALLDRASNILSKRRAGSSQRGTSLADRLEEISRRKLDGINKAGPLVMEKKLGSPAGIVSAEPNTKPEWNVASTADNIFEVLESGSVEDIKKVVQKLKELLGLDVPEPEEVVFDEIDFEDGERQVAKERQALKVATFDQEHKGHTYFCEGDIWGEVVPGDPYMTTEGDIRRQNGQCDRCTGSMMEGDVWVCEVGFCGILICGNCWKDYESDRAKLK